MIAFAVAPKSATSRAWMSEVLRPVLLDAPFDVPRIQGSPLLAPADKGPSARPVAIPSAKTAVVRTALLPRMRAMTASSRPADTRIQVPQPPSPTAVWLARIEKGNRVPTLLGGRFHRGRRCG